MFPQLDIATCPTIPLKDKVTYFSNITLLHGADLEEQQIKLIKEKIKELVESPLTRHEGLLLFEAALQQYTPFYIRSWPQIVLANLSSSDVISHEITYRIIKLILKPSKHPAHLSTAQYYAPKILDILLLPNNATCVAAIQCVSQCLKIHPGVVFTYKNLLESFIMRQMDTNSTQICEAISECFVRFLHGTSTMNSDRNTSSKKTYVFYYKKSLYTLQEIVNNLLNTNDVFFIGNDSHDSTPETFPLPEIPDVPFSATLTLARIFASLSVCTAKILCSESQDKKQFEVPVIWILEFISRIFDMTQLVKNAESTEQGELILLAYPIIQKGSFIILESLIQNFGLIEQVENIILLIRKSVEASYLTAFSNISNRQIRYISWKVLHLWMSKNGTQVTFDAGNRKFLIQELLKDIVPENIEEAAQRHHPLSKVKNPEGIFPEPDETSNFNKLKMKTCDEALKVLKGFIYTTSPFLEEKFKEEISSSVITTARKVQKNIHPHKKFPFPYINDKCRKNLYELCLAFVVSSNFHIRVVMQSVAVLKIAQKDQSLKIKEFCRIANPLYRLLLHPKKKFPEVVTNKKVVFEPTVEENVCFGWDNVAPWSINSDRGNHSTNTSNCRPDDLSPETHDISENEMQNNYVSEKEYNSSEYETPYAKGEVQCNGDDLSEVQVSSQSESESEEGTMENETAEEENNQESPTKPFISAVHSAENVREEAQIDHEITSEEDNMSVTEEQPEDHKADDEELKQLNHNETTIHADQNGLATTSEDEMPSSTREENGEYSSDEDGSYEEEEEETRELYEDQKREVENSDVNEPPVKKQKISDEADQAQEDLDEIKTDEVKDVQENAEKPNEVHEEESSRSKSPTFEQMCGDLVLCESAELAES